MFEEKDFKAELNMLIGAPESYAMRCAAVEETMVALKVDKGVEVEV